MRRLKLSAKVCAFCHKGDSVGYNRPHSLHKTKRVVKPNLQSYSDPASGLKFIACTRCIRTTTKATTA